MGREIRRVPPDWQHPDNDDPNDVERCSFKPLFDRTFAEAMEQWEANMALWDKGQHFFQLRNPKSFAGLRWIDVEDMPTPDGPYRTRSWTKEEATHYQLYETVTEGSPCSPVFATLQELEDYLVEHGDLHYQNIRHEPWSREAAHAFCLEGWAPSLIGTTINNPEEKSS